VRMSDVCKEAPGGSTGSASGSLLLDLDGLEVVSGRGGGWRWTANLLPEVGDSGTVGAWRSPLTGGGAEGFEPLTPCMPLTSQPLRPQRVPTRCPAVSPGQQADGMEATRCSLWHVRPGCWQVSNRTLGITVPESPSEHLWCSAVLGRLWVERRANGGASSVYDKALYGGQRAVKVTLRHSSGHGQIGAQEVMRRSLLLASFALAPGHGGTRNRLDADRWRGARPAGRLRHDAAPAPASPGRSREWPCWLRWGWSPKTRWPPRAPGRAGSSAPATLAEQKFEHGSVRSGSRAVPSAEPSSPGQALGGMRCGGW
jgi:hypothetical protein